MEKTLGNLVIDDYAEIQKYINMYKIAGYDTENISEIVEKHKDSYRLYAIHGYLKELMLFMRNTGRLRINSIPVPEVYYREDFWPF